eukprot:Nitzschia sp. Nitz4//scaffold33_size148984//11444//14014//NITZ4_002910-RA/size148984-snap-gene-0.17-mRNA-1//-1//CDS//3329548373//4559//frame0
MSKSTSSSQEFGDMESVSTNNTSSNAGSNELGNFVLKLKIKASDGTPQIRRVRLSRLLNESGGVSYQELVGLTLTFTYPEGSKEDFHVSLTYFDADDDTITIASDEELLDAIEQFKEAKVLRITTEVKPKAAATFRVSDRGTSTADAAGFHHRPHRNVLGSVVGALSSAVSQVQDTFTTEEGTAPPPPSAPREPEPASENANAQTTASAPAPAADDAEEDEDSPELFIHGRHTCDSCLVTPIVGKRYHADNIPDYDLCEKCYSNYTGKDIKFSSVELDRDRAFQLRWRRRQEKIKLFNRKRGGPRCNRRPFRGPGHEKVSVPPEVAAKHVKKEPTGAAKDTKDAPGCGPPPPCPPHGPPPPNCHPPPPPHGPPHGPPPPGCHPPPPPHGPPHGPPPPPPPPHCPHFGPDGFGPPPPFGPPHGPPHGPPPHFWHGMHGAHHFMHGGMKHSHGPFPDPMFMGMGPPDGFPPQAHFAPHAGRRRPSERHNDDDDLKEAIRRSLKDIALAKFKNVQDAKAPPQEAKAPVVEPKVTEEVEVVVESKAATTSTETTTEDDLKLAVEDTMEVDTSAMEEAMETTSVDSEKLLAEDEIVVPPVEPVDGTPRSISRDESYESEAAGSGEVAEAMGATLDKVAGMISEILVEADSPAKKAPEATNKADEAATEAQGTLILENTSSADKKDKEENEWEVVDDVEDKSSQGDDGIARAASMLGSALFNSDMKESVKNESVGNVSNLSDSFSVPSTVPTVTQPSSASRWRVQLDQLAELGFIDEAKIIEIIERMEAANIGSDEDQTSISISRVVEALLEN